MPSLRVPLSRPFLLLPTTSSSSFRSTICSSKMSTASGQSEPICRKFIPVEQSDITSISKPDGFKFSLVSYNILAQAYVKSSLFPYCPSPCLNPIILWKARSQSVLAVLKNLEADFLCLQELDEYDTFYKENVEKDGFSSIYVKRSGQKRDGCGIFYKPDKSELVMEEKIDYNDLVDLIQDEETVCIDRDKSTLAPGRKNGSPEEGPEKTKGDRGDPNDPRVRLKRDCVGIMAAFKLKDPSQHFVIVANTHIYWDPEWADVKLAQAKYLLSRISQFKTMISDSYECSPSVIIAGDFNSVPGDKVYEYLISGSSSLVHLPQCSEDRPISLTSVYAYTRGKEPKFTNCTPGFTGTLDYIFFCTPFGEIKPVSFLELPETESSDVKGGLPNWFHPSDHLPIGAEFLVV